jgi:plastocyanin
MIRMFSVLALLSVTSVAMSDTYTISTSGYSFDPPMLDVQPGDEINFVIGSGHTATSGSSCTSDGMFDSGSSFTWIVPGSTAGTTIDYFCDPHCAMGMTGTINVAGAGGSDTMALSYVSSAAADFLHWYATPAYDAFYIQNDSHHPYQIALEVEGSWDITVLEATNAHVYTAGSGTVPLPVGTVTLGDGYHIIHNDPNWSSILRLELPGPAMMGPGSEPLWDDIKVWGGHVEWKMVDGALRHRYMGNNAHSFMQVWLNQPSGTGEIDVSYIGDTYCTSLTLPAELEEATVSVPAGYHCFNAGISGDGPWTLYVGIGGGPEFCREDVNEDGEVNIDDLLQVIGAWGVCP